MTAPPRLPPDGRLSIGSLSDLPVPEDAAVRFLKQAAGSLVTVTLTHR